MPANRKAQIERINQVSAMARTSWIALLGYLAFIGVTLLGVEDADFFVPSRQTQLPLVNVSIPTASFFIFAPILAAALYIYLHIILLKLWDAIADANTPRIDGHPLGDHLNPWLVNDWALTRKAAALHPRPPAPRPRQRRQLPPRLGRRPRSSSPSSGGVHARARRWLTLLLAACFLIALAAGLTGWRTARAWLAAPARPAPPEAHPPALPRAFLVVFAPPHRASAPAGANPRRPRPPTPSIWALAAGSSPSSPWSAPPGPRRAHPPLARADLASVELVALPEGWRDWETARTAFRETWCSAKGLDMAVCGQPPRPGAETHRTQTRPIDRTDGAEHGSPLARRATQPSQTRHAVRRRLARGTHERGRRPPRLDLAAATCGAHSEATSWGEPRDAR